MIMALPTGRGWVFCFAAVSSMGVALVNVGLATALCASALCATVLSSLLLAQFSLYKLSVRRDPCSDGTAGKKMTLPITVINHTPFFRQSPVLVEKCAFLGSGVLRTACRPLPPRGVCREARPVVPVRRGSFLLDKVQLIGGDPAGLFRKTKVFSLPAELLITPFAANVEMLPLKSGGRPRPSLEGRLLGHSGFGQEFFGMRPYRSGDGMRFIHWKGTAAKGHLMVKEFEANTLDNIAIIIDSDSGSVGLDRYENNFEFLVSVASSLVKCLAEMYCQISFYCFDADGVIFRISGEASGAAGRINDFLTLVEPGKNNDLERLLGETAESLPTGSILYVLSMSQSENTCRLLELLSEYDIEIRWIYAPGRLFPTVDENMPRVIEPDKIELTHCGAAEQIPAAFNSSISDMLQKTR